MQVMDVTAEATELGLGMPELLSFLFDLVEKVLVGCVN